MRRTVVLFAFILLSFRPLFADVTLTDKGSAMRAISESPLTPEQKQAVRDANKAKKDAKRAKQGQHGLRVGLDTALTPAQKQAIRDANQTKREAKRAKHSGHGLKASSASLHARGDATGSIQLIDSAGLKYFINTNITFSTSSSASGAASEASYTGPIAASTSAGGTTMSTLSDMFDGYNGLCVSLTNATGPCQTGNANYVMYEKNGPASVDNGVPATPECTNRQYVTPIQTIGALQVQRKIYVPPNDQYVRWLNYFTNTSGAPVTFTAITSNNLGSDSNTRIVSSSSGDNVATVTDLWVSTFQNYSGNTSSDPRIGHVLQGAGAATPVSNINFADGDDNPYWTYSITLNPGQTKVIVNYATGQGTKAAANAKAAALAAFGPTAQQCLGTDISEVVNFAASADLSIVKTASVVTNVNAGAPYSYTLAVTNNGPASASSVSVTDVLPAGVGFVSASGTGWTCIQSFGTVTCTMPTLAVGAANPITINVTAPASGSVVNTATVSSSTTDPTPANNSSTNTLTVVNQADLSITKSTSPATVTPGSPVVYTINVTNNGPSPATSVTVTDPLPAGITFFSASGTGWSCSQAPVGTVTCTRASLAVGPASPITINAIANQTTGVKNNVATIASTTPDPNAANNTSAPATVTVQSVAIVPTLDPKALALLAAILGAVAIIAMKRNG